MRKENKSDIENRLRERRVMECGEECEVIKYRRYSDITVKFLKTGELVNCQYGQFKNGLVKSHFSPSVCGIGIVGLEKTKENNKQLKSYEIWRDMLRRCYDEIHKEKRKTYKDCSVCEEWLYYPNFKKWYNEN
ncbi:hypothetical protein [Clostridium perfringens]|uniref:hypothetical protein n=1 Tax=Clostridium perfringens TaxID=1502 RepID=UPI00096AB669|nr:hypothetical protein [Clostridium perfringens]